MSKPDFDPFDPVSAAMGALHNQNLLAAKEAQINQLKAADHTEFWTKACKDAEERCANQAQSIQSMRYAGNELARVLDDIMQSELCQFDAISKAVCIATIAKWNRAKTGQL
jgi:hypothetical protein